MDGESKLRYEALRLTLLTGTDRKSKDYARHEAALKDAVTAMGCKVTSNMTSLIVLNLPDNLAGREMELVQNCRARGFGIWPTLSEPVQIRIGILNQVSESQISKIVGLFAQAMNELGADIDVNKALARLQNWYAEN